MKLFSGTANQALSEEVAKLLHIPLAKSEVVRFLNSEVRVRIQDSVAQETAIVIQPIANPTDTNLMELVFFCDALRRQEAKKVIGYIPYFGYARQNIQHRPGECVSANVVIRMLESIGFYKVYTLDLHDEDTEGVFSIPFKNLSALPLLAQEIKKTIDNLDSVVVVSPDQGGIQRAREFSDVLFPNKSRDIVVIEKKRNQAIIHHSKAVDLYGDVTGKTVIIVDDMTTSADTLIHASDLCLAKGAKKTLAAVVHHDFADNAPQKIQQSSLSHFFTTNTIALKPEHQFEKLTAISIAPIIAEEIKNAIKK